MKEKLKKVDLKKIIKGLSIVWFIGLVVFMTIANLGFNDEFNLKTWLGNALLLMGIMVFGLLMGESIGTDKQMEKVGGLYQKSLFELNNFLDEINDILIYFVQFFQWFLTQELFDKKVNYLVMNNIDINKAKQIIKYCNLKDLFELKSHAIEKTDDEGNKFCIRQLDENQIEAVEEVLRGKIKLDASNPNYYLTAFGKSNSKSVLEVGKQLDKEIKFNKKSNRLLKITFSLIISLIWGLLTVKDFASGNDVQAWANLISRIAAILTSLTSGWLSSTIDVKLKSEQLNNKLKVLTLFKNALDKKIFIPQSEEELAQKEYQNYLKEQEEQKKNVITPELITSSEDVKSLTLNK